MKPGRASQPLVLVPGTLCDRRLWQYPLESLAPLCTSITVADVSGANTISGLAQAILEGAPEQFSLAGFSLGGIIALEMLRQEPQRILRLALLDTNARSAAPEHLQLRLHQMQRVRNGELAEVLNEELLPNYFAAQHQENTGLRHQVLQMGLEIGSRAFLHQCEAANNRPSALDLLPWINSPTLVLCGREDQLCPVSMHEQMAESIPGSELRIIENCGHFSPLECPNEVSAALQEWLNKPLFAPTPHKLRPEVSQSI